MMKGQISAEMLIILALVVVIALLVASQLLGLVNFFGAKVSNKTIELDGILDEGSCINSGLFCSSDSNCCDNSCVNNVCT